MLPILQRRFRALENSKAALLAQFRAIPQERALLRPAEGKWSAAELLSHITRVEDAVLGQVRQKLAEAQNEPVSVSNRVGSMIVRNVMRMPIRVKVPAEVPAVLPDAHADVADVLAQWENTRDGWRNLLEGVRGPRLKGGVFSHPKVGWFTLPETVLFLRLHHDHHKAQLARIAKAATALAEPIAA